MCKHKYRGKRLDTQEWVYGGYIENINHQHYIIAWDAIYKLYKLNNDKTIVSNRIYEVLPETVGEYTGLNNIYEGDKLGGKYEHFHIAYCDMCKSLEPFATDGNICMSCERDFNWQDLVEDEEELETVGAIYDNL